MLFKVRALGHPGQIVGVKLRTLDARRISQKELE